jgi:nucleoside-diphosphate-sugar epimerase
VTGAAGFVGANVVRALAQAGEAVIAFDLSAPDELLQRYASDPAASVTWEQGDVRNWEALAELAKQRQATRLVHLAALTPNLKAERAQSAEIIDVNFGGTVNALEAARQVDAERLVFLSSTALYGAPAGNPFEPIPESSPLQTRNLYTILKHSGELVCRRYAELHGLSAVSARLGAVYGPMERPTGTRPNLTDIYHLTQSLLNRQALRVKGLPLVREWTYIVDAARAIAGLALADTLRHDVYNVSGGRVYSFAEVLVTLLQLEPSYQFTPVEGGALADIVMTNNDQRGPLDTTRLQQDTGFEPRYDLEAGLRDYLDWSRHNGST